MAPLSADLSVMHYGRSDELRFCNIHLVHRLNDWINLCSNDTFSRWIARFNFCVIVPSTGTSLVLTDKLPPRVLRHCPHPVVSVVQMKNEGASLVAAAAAAAAADSRPHCPFSNNANNCSETCYEVFTSKTTWARTLCQVIIVAVGLLFSNSECTYVLK